MDRETTGEALPAAAEAQWEYVCRAGRESAYWFGDQITKDQANFEAKATGWSR